MYIWHICAKVTFTKQTKGSKVGFTHVEGSDLGHALMTWPKLLNYQLIFCKSNFIFWMSKLFDWTKIFSLLNITFWTISKIFWYSQNEIGFSKHWLGLQKFWTLDFIASMGSNPWGSLIYITIDLLFHKSQWGILSSSISIYSNLHEIKMTPHTVVPH